MEEAIDWAGVREVVAVPPQKLSGGEKQRVALARAKVLAPQLLLLDEPTANLDADGRRRIIELLARLFAEGVSVLIACHDRELIELPGVRRFHLENGKLVLAEHCSPISGGRRPVWQWNTAKIARSTTTAPRPGRAPETDEDFRLCRLVRQRQDHADRAADPALRAARPARSR